MLPVLRQVSVGRILMDRDVVLGLDVGQGTLEVLYEGMQCGESDNVTP